MTWIRWECDSPNHEVVGALAEELGISEAQALGHYVAVCCGFGHYLPSGRADGVPDLTIERWALWAGKRGRFSEAFRRYCVEAVDDGLRVKGWWRQRALLEKQAKDAEKPGQGTREARERPATGSGVPLGCNDDGNDKASSKLDLGPFAEAWEAHLGGLPPFGRLGRALKPLVSRHGAPEVLSRWLRYLEEHRDKERKFLSPEGFASKFGVYEEASIRVMTDENGVDRPHRKNEAGEWVAA